MPNESKEADRDVRAFEALGKRLYEENEMNDNIFNTKVARAFEPLGKRTFESNEYLSSKELKRAFEALGKRKVLLGLVENSREKEEHKLFKKAFEALGKRAFEPLGRK